MKFCNKCQTEKDLNSFSPKGRVCRPCQSIINHNRYQSDPEKAKTAAKQWRRDNPEKKKESSLAWYYKNKDKALEQNKKWVSDNPERKKEISNKAGRKYKANNPEKKKASDAQYRENNQELIKKSRKISRSKNKKQTNLYQKNKKQTDPLYACKVQARTMIRDSFRRFNGSKKNGRSFDIIGITPDELLIHLSNTFFANYGRHKTMDDVVHIDHIIPLSSARHIDDVWKLCHYTNLQYLLAADNLKKSNKVDFVIQKEGRG